MSDGKAYGDMRLVKGCGDTPRPLADIVAEDRAIEDLAIRYADMAAVRVTNSHAAAQDAYLRIVACAFERASEIVRGRMSSVQPQTEQRDGTA